MHIKQITPITAGQIRRGGYSSPYDQHLGISPTRDFFSDNERSTITVIPPDVALNPHACVHGGYVASVLDTGTGYAAYSNQPGSLDDKEYALTSSLNVEFNAPVFSGQTYTCEGKIIGREGNNIRTKATLTDDKGIQVASATALIKARRTDYRV